MTYKYGMRLRGFSLGCQPMEGFLKRYDDYTGKYYDILEYNRKLTKEEMNVYSLVLIQDKKKISEKQFQKLNCLFPELKLIRDRDELHFYLNCSHYYLTKNGVMWCIYEVYNHGTICYRTTELGTNFKDMIKTLKIWVEDKK